VRALRAVLALSLLLAACGTEDPEPTPEPDDGKYRPPPSGERTTEASACNTLVDAHGDRMLSLGCAGTSRTCPAFLRAQFEGVACMEYDKGSVDGCLEFYATKTTCPELSAALETCVITAYEGSMSANCP